MPFDSRERDRLRAPELTAQEIAEVADRTVATIRDRLIRKGVAADAAARLASDSRGRVEVHSRIGGPVVQVRGTNVQGGYSLDVLVDDLARRARLAEFGSDPEALVRNQLAAAGLDDASATEQARGRAWRAPDGAIVVRLGPGQEVRGTDPEDHRPVELLVRALADGGVQPAIAEHVRDATRATVSYGL